MVNERLVLDWDIPASNGIIHIIEAPLMAPPVRVSEVNLMYMKPSLGVIHSAVRILEKESPACSLFLIRDSCSSANCC